MGILALEIRNKVLLYVPLCDIRTPAPCYNICHFAFYVSHAVYGWKDTFPIEVRKGGTLILTVGYLKGTTLGRVLFRAEYDTNGERKFTTAMFVVELP